MAVRVSPRPYIYVSRGLKNDAPSRFVYVHENEYLHRPLRHGLIVGRPIASRMSRRLIGAGGWGYFSGGLRSYARAFPFVEVNATFYRHIPESYARRWRAQVPADFVFSVKVHRDVTHGSGLVAPIARAALAHDARLARILRAPFLILETPARLAFTAKEAGELRDLVSGVDVLGRIGLEARAHARGPLPAALKSVLRDLDMLDVVDLSRQSPRVEDEVVYTRVFGKGSHNLYEFTDQELRDLDRSGRDAVEVAFAFHGVRMYRDAARFLTFKRTGAFPQATSSVGLDSLAERLREDARFPAARADLMRDHGWKVIDLDPSTRVHAGRLLARLPPARFESVDAVVRALAGPNLDVREAPPAR